MAEAVCKTLQSREEELDQAFVSMKQIVQEITDWITENEESLAYVLK